MAKMLPGMLLGLAMAALLSGTMQRRATADPQEAKSKENRPTRIALIDMAKVFKTSKLFNRKREDLKVEIAESEEIAKTMQTSVLQIKTELEGVERDSEERAALERKMKSKAAEFEKFRKEKQQIFLKAESGIYVEIYELVTAEVAKYAREHEIDAVFRFNAEPFEKDDPAKLMNSMNRQVVYENGLDITDDIIAAVN